MKRNKRLHRDTFFGANAANRSPPWKRRPEKQNQDQQRHWKQSSRKFPSCKIKYRIKVPRLHSWAAIDRPETTKTTTPRILEVVWQQPVIINVNIINKGSNTETHKNTHTPNLQQSEDVVTQTSPIDRTYLKILDRIRKRSWKPNWNTSVRCLNDSQQRQLELQENNADMTANDIGDHNISAPKKLHKLKSDL